MRWRGKHVKLFLKYALHLEIKDSYWNECLRIPLQASRVLEGRMEPHLIRSLLKAQSQGHLTLETIIRVLFLEKPREPRPYTG